MPLLLESETSEIRPALAGALPSRINNEMSERNSGLSYDPRIS